MSNISDWMPLIELVSGGVIGGFVFKAIDRVRFKKENKIIKKDEANKAEVETDKQQIDLGDLFLEKSAKWSEILEKNTERMIAKMDESNAQRNEDWRVLRNDIEEIKSDITEIKHRQDLEEEFLNGKYADFLREKGETVKRKTNGKKKTVPMPRRKNVAGNVRDVRPGESDKGKVVGFTSKADLIVLPPFGCGSSSMGDVRDGEVCKEKDLK